MNGVFTQSFVRGSANNDKGKIVSSQSWTSVVSRSKNSKLESMKRLNRSNESAMQLREKRVGQSISSGEWKVDGRKEAFTEFLELLDTLPFWFNIVTP
jgi:alkyl sulfatase BDS1-like metallo-beta-lactamase superfamily hydrolase